MVWIVGLAVLVVWIACHGWGYPLWYNVRARKHGFGSLKAVRSTPFGIPQMRAAITAARDDKILEEIKEAMLKRHADSPTFLREGLFAWNIVTRDPRNVKVNLSTRFHDYSVGHRSNHLRAVFGSGIFTQDGTEWKHSRALLKPQFAKEQNVRLTTISKHVDKVIGLIHSRNGGVIELQHYLHLLTLDTATELLLGESVNSLEDAKGVEIRNPKTCEVVTSADFVESYQWLSKFGLVRVVLNHLSWMTTLGARLTRRGVHFHKRRVHTFIEHFVESALRATSDSTKPAPEDEYIFSHSLSRETRDPTEIRDQIFNILVAGRDPTAATLSFALYYLALYPEYWQTLRTEILENIPTSDNSDFTYSSLRQLRWMRLFLTEVLRVAPVIPLNMRTAVRDTILPAGGGDSGNEPVFVPKGTVIQYSPYVIHRDPDMYGPDADEFRPERWQDSSAASASMRSSWGYIPFNGGPRICIGQQFALTEITLTLSKLIRAFDTIERGPGFPEGRRRDRTMLTLSLGAPRLPICIYNRSDKV